MIINIYFKTNIVYVLKTTTILIVENCTIKQLSKTVFSKYFFIYLAKTYIQNNDYTFLNMKFKDSMHSNF